ncbi:hypothetical protein Patl1_03642 [Pistacia atlantica]|uniref:Uncharacterized protein n=1 Tax=Pistacia atlantica TaxID=434234 RepID=A0ACC1C859_9ROSI|nr:hypothetical protein Patl1_03642 [Pistacia atlantica]
MVVMIIKGLFRRYERWNPVHPTRGAFWGMGVGIGCGVGWGPGFGPEVIGYVGAGCGVGFSVGFTFAGVGIGLPANFIFQLPYNAINATRSGAFELALSNAKNVAGDGWNHISGVQRETTARFSSFKQKSDVHLKSIWEGFGRSVVCFLGPGKVAWICICTHAGEECSYFFKPSGVLFYMLSSSISSKGLRKDSNIQRLKSLLVRTHQ